jgi:hypothetical protein
MAPADQVWLQSLHANGPALIASDPKDFQNLINGMEFSAAHVLPDQMVTDFARDSQQARYSDFRHSGRG